MCIRTVQAAVQYSKYRINGVRYYSVLYMQEVEYSVVLGMCGTTR